MLEYTYAEAGDILFVSKGDQQECEADSKKDNSGNFIFHRGREDQLPNSVTIYNFAKLWRGAREQVAQPIAEYLRFPQEEIEREILKIPAVRELSNLGRS